MGFLKYIIIFHLICVWLDLYEGITKLFRNITAKFTLFLFIYGII